MPLKKRISDVEEIIEATRLEITRLRNDGAGRGEPKSVAKVDNLLVTLARLRAERLRLMRRQLTVDLNSK